MGTIAITEAKNNHIVPVWLIIFLVLVGACTFYRRGVAFKNQRIIQILDASFIILIQIFYPQMHQKSLDISQNSHHNKNIPFYVLNFPKIRPQIFICLFQTSFLVGSPVSNCGYLQHTWIFGFILKHFFFNFLWQPSSGVQKHLTDENVTCDRHILHQTELGAW